MQLNQVLNYINQALNYPSITYDDVSLFFDSAITELNTSLHTKIPLVSNMLTEFSQYMSKYSPNRVLLFKFPEDTDTIPSYESVAEALGVRSRFAYFPNEKSYGILNHYATGYDFYKDLYGIYANAGSPIYFKAVKFSQEDALWVIDPQSDFSKFNFDVYLPDSWVILWLIPYVCFKYTVRDGGTAASFAEDLTQGFQQLQNAYDVPSTVNLASVAGMPAYHFLVSENINNLNINVPTRAIYETMQHKRALNATYGNVYDREGFLYD